MSGGPVGTSERKGMNLKTKTKSEMLFPGCEKSGPCGLVTPNSTEYVVLKGLECLTSARKGLGR